MEVSRIRALRGLSVYTLSEKASDREADMLASRENRADALGGVNLASESDQVASILIDLAQRGILIARVRAGAARDSPGKCRRIRVGIMIRRGQDIQLPHGQPGPGQHPRLDAALNGRTAAWPLR